MDFITSLFDIWIIITSIVLFLLGVTKKEKYNIQKSEKYKLLILGVGLLVLYSIVNGQSMYQGFVDGFNAS